MHTSRLAVASILFLGLGFGQSVVAGEDQWQYEFTPYLFMAGMDGVQGVHGYTTDLDVSFSDIVDHLDMGFMGHFTAQKGPWTFGLEGVYMDLGAGQSNTVTGPRGIVSRDGELELSVAMYVFQGTAGYSLLSGPTRLNAIGGLRYTRLEADMQVTLDFTPPLFGGERSAGGDESWLDAVVGMHLRQALSKNVDFALYADIGGGGSDLTYQVIAGFNWAFSEGFTAKAGYRNLYWDYEDEDTVCDVTASGPYLGLGIQF